MAQFDDTLNCEDTSQPPRHVPGFFCAAAPAFIASRCHRMPGALCGHATRPEPPAPTLRTAHARDAGRRFRPHSDPNTRQHAKPATCGAEASPSSILLAQRHLSACIQSLPCSHKAKVSQHELANRCKWGPARGESTDGNCRCSRLGELASEIYSNLIHMFMRPIQGMRLNGKAHGCQRIPPTEASAFLKRKLDDEGPGVWRESGSCPSLTALC